MLTLGHFRLNLNTMIIKRAHEVSEEMPSLEGTKECTVRWLIAEKDSAKHYAMRLFELQPSGIIPLHSHEDKEHEIFIIEGNGVLNDGKKNIQVMRGDVIFIEPDEKHSFVNNSDGVLKFICVIPIV
ncbi:Oxalate-binding protein [subsurface metagenome]